MLEAETNNLVPFGLTAWTGSPDSDILVTHNCLPGVADAATCEAAGRLATAEQDVQHQARHIAINVAPTTLRPLTGFAAFTGGRFLPVFRRYVAPSIGRVTGGIVASPERMRHLAADAWGS
jgi:hypothetical protein